MEITAFSPARIAGYGTPPVSAARRPAATAADRSDVEVRSRAPVEYAVQGEVLEKRRESAYSKELLEAMRSLEREFRLNVQADSTPKRADYAWGAIAAYQHTAFSTAPTAAAAANQTIDYYI